MSRKLMIQMFRKVWVSVLGKTYGLTTSGPVAEIISDPMSFPQAIRQT